MTGTHCSLMAKRKEIIFPARYARECEIEGRLKMKKACQEHGETLKRGLGKRSGNLVDAAETSEELTEWQLSRASEKSLKT